METGQIVAIVLCFCMYSVISPINLFVCGIDTTNGIRPKNAPCSAVLGGINYLLCCLALALFAGFIKI